MTAKVRNHKNISYLRSLNFYQNMLDFTKEYILEDERVLLRPLQLDDFDHLISFAFAEPEIWKYSLVSVDGESGLTNYIQTAITEREQLKSYPFIVFDKKTQKYAGSTRFYDIQLSYNTTQLGYTWYGKNFQGTGLNYHCKYLLLKFAFEEMQFERVEFRADNRNERSKAAMKKIGCTVEGLLRNSLPTIEGGRRDSIILSILKEEWFGRVKQNLFNSVK
jgi:N-acetyltransferase